jgi:hypothetical protein
LINPIDMKIFLNTHITCLVVGTQNQGRLEKTCIFCKNSGPNQYFVFSNRYLEQKYFEAFNFYFAKPINEIIANVSLPHVINFRDKEIEDEENEYLRRFYSKHEIGSRISALSSFFKNTYKPTFPNLCVIEQARVLKGNI